MLCLCTALLSAAPRVANAADYPASNDQSIERAAAFHGTVLVFPLSVVGDTNTSAWIGQAMQQSMLDTLSRNFAIKVISARAPEGGADDAMAQARRAGADFFIAGSCQRVADTLRVIAAVNDVNGNRIRSLAARGSIVDLFLMEDALDGQLESLRPAAKAAPAIGSGYPNLGAQLRMAAEPTYGDGTELAQEIADGPANAADPKAAAAYLRYADQYPCYWGCNGWGYGCGWGGCGWGGCGWGGGGYYGWTGNWSSPVGNSLYAAPLPP